MCSGTASVMVFVIFRFRSITCNVPGSAHDASVLRLSTVYLRSEELLPREERIFRGRPIPFMLLGDPAYPRLPWILKGYTWSSDRRRDRGTNNEQTQTGQQTTRATGLTKEEESFNVYHSAGRNVVEHAFGRLKARWRVTLKRADINYKFMPTVIAAACILHNFCEQRSEGVRDAWIAAVRDCEQYLYQQPASSPRDANAVCEVRDFLRDYLAQEFPLRSASW